MRCPSCKSTNFIVINTDNKFESFTHRYRKCSDCFVTWKTKELVVDGSIHKNEPETLTENEDEDVNILW